MLPGEASVVYTKVLATVQNDVLKNKIKIFFILNK
jgi:hypothetical protein